MASPELCNGLDGGLPLDAMYEILVRLPAKELCRLRAVCRFWRSILSDPEFAAAHAARRREPPLIIAAGYNCHSSETSLANIIDLSGEIVKQVRLDGHWVMSLPLNFVCVMDIADNESWRLLDPATAATRYHVREDLAEEDAFDWGWGNLAGHRQFRCHNMNLFGQVASTGEHKVFRKKVTASSHVGDYGSRYEICTLSSGSHPQWRAVQGPANTFGWPGWTSVVIDGVAYMLMADVCRAISRKTPVIQQDWIYSFDLETEKWRPNIKGPQGFLPDNAAGPNHHLNIQQVSLANLNGSLVIVHGPSPNLDIWFLKDVEKGLWVKQYNIQIEGLYTQFWPLFVLDDGRIVIVRYVRDKRTVGIHSPGTNTFAVVADMSHFQAISVYTGNLLSLESWHSINNEVTN